MDIRVQLRPLQAKAIRALDSRRFGVLICHRRFGKTVLAISRLVRNACNGNSTYRGAYIAPTYRQAKDVSWDYLKKLAKAADAKINESELRVDFPHGARIKLYGAENPDSLRGLDICDVVFDEVAQMPLSTWSEIVQPMILAKKGIALFMGTPKGKNALWQIWDEAKVDEKNWVTQMYKASETGILTDEDLKLARQGMSESQYEQEFECSFSAAVQGAYYAKQLEELEQLGRITGVPYDPAVPVTTAWDLGFSDSTAIWFAQQVGREIHIIDYYEAAGEGLAHYVKVLKDKPYLYAEHLLPHDAAASELGTGTTRLETLRKLGLKGHVLPQVRLDDGINGVRMLLPRCWFDAIKCQKGLDCLRWYQREWDEKSQDFRNRPLHDWSSHGADAFRYLAMGINRISGESGFKKLKKRKNLRVC
jgi:hypothetical protein